MLSPLCTKMSWEHLTSTISASYDHAKVELFCKKYLTCHHDYVNVLISFTVHFFFDVIEVLCFLFSFTNGSSPR